MSNKVYDTLKFTALVFVPICAFISTVLPIWNVPCSDQITSTLVAVDALLGTLVKILSDNYNKKQAEKVEKAKELNNQNGV